MELADNQEQEKTYEVKDKRRINPDGTIRENTEEQEEAKAQTPGETVESSTQEPEEAGELPVASVYDILQFVAGMLSEQAWQKMGLRLAPGQKEMTKDMTQAKLAIDTIAFIVDKLHPHIGENERRALRGILSDLQLNFVKQSQ